MKSKTFIFFIVSVLVFITSFLLTIFKAEIGLNDDLMIVGLLATISFGVSIAGLVIGLSEIRRMKTSINWVGLVGNVVLVGIYILIMIFALSIT